MFDDFYGFETRPFQLTPDPQFYFNSATHRKALSYLGYGLAQGEGFIVITGEVGAGKSTLVAHMMDSVDRNRLTVAQIVTSALGGEEVVHVVAQAFGLDIAGHDKASALGAIEGLLHEEAREGRRCLLVVDESQNLSVSALEELRMLSNFQLGSHPLLQTLLLGQPEFRATLQCPELEQLRQRVIAAHHLEPMEEDEVEPYIMHRLATAGWRGVPVFEPELFGEIHAASDGIPRRINQIANRLLLLGAIERSDTIDLAMLGIVITELEGERADSLAGNGPAPTFAQRPDDAAGGPENVAPQPAAAPDMAALLADRDGRIEQLERKLAAMLSERDMQIAELRQAVAQLHGEREVAEPAGIQAEMQALHDRLSQMEAQSLEHERTIRHTLTMLIEWIEGEVDQARAA